MNQPQLLSNSFDDFAAGGSLYPGGSGIVTDAGYRLWDYGGKQAPDSVCAVYLLMQPNDGSNENKPVEIYWSVGQSSDFQPDHTHGFVSSNTKAGIPASSNWGFVNEKFKLGCGLDMAMLNQPGVGIRALIGGQITLTRVDQPTREGLEKIEEPGQHKNKFKPTILIPTRFIGSWEQRGGAPRPVTQMPNPAPTMGYQPPPPQFQPPPPQFQQPAAPAFQPPPPAFVPQMAPASTPGSFAPPATPNGQFDIGGTLRQILMESGGAITIADIPKSMLNKLVSLDPQSRLGVMTAVNPQNLPQTAAAYGLRFDGNVLSQ